MQRSPLRERNRANERGAVRTRRAAEKPGLRTPSELEHRQRNAAGRTNPRAVHAKARPQFWTRRTEKIGAQDPRSSWLPCPVVFIFLHLDPNFRRGTRSVRCPAGPCSAEKLFCFGAGWWELGRRKFVGAGGGFTIGSRSSPLFACPRYYCMYADALPRTQPRVRRLGFLRLFWCVIGLPENQVHGVQTAPLARQVCLVVCARHASCCSAASSTHRLCCFPSRVRVSPCLVCVCACRCSPCRSA